MTADLNQNASNSLPDPKESTSKAVPASFKNKSRKITMDDLNAMAKLCSKRLTEVGACLVLGINPDRWREWKAKHKRSTAFDNAITRIREAKLEACIDSIDEAGNSFQSVSKSGQVFERPGDWRAKAWMAERVLAPERLGQQQTPQTNQTVILGDDALKRILETVYQPKTVIDCPVEPKQIVDKP